VSASNQILNRIRELQPTLGMHRAKEIAIAEDLLFRAQTATTIQDLKSILCQILEPQTKIGPFD
jgi:hypothetical protein